MTSDINNLRHMIDPNNNRTIVGLDQTNKGRVSYYANQVSVLDNRGITKKLVTQHSSQTAGTLNEMANQQGTSVQAPPPGSRHM